MRKEQATGISPTMRRAVIHLWARHIGRAARANLIFNQAGENQVSAESLGLIQVGKSRYQVAGFATRVAEIVQCRGSTFDKNLGIKDCRVSLGFCRKEIKEIKQFKREKTRRASRPNGNIEFSTNRLKEREEAQRAERLGEA